jgi:hypothetical protein
MTKNIWQADMNRISAALTEGGYIHSDSFGSWIDPSAPAVLQSSYAALTSIGYWEGWAA